ncbi:MAG: pyruvate kinase [Saprospiraceae bacterium]
MTPDVSTLKERIRHILNLVIQTENKFADLLQLVQPHYYESARNLVHYLALRTFDLHQIQEELSTLSISSLSHSEGYTLTNLQNILSLLQLLNGEKITDNHFRSPFDYRKSKSQLQHNTLELFGRHHRGEGSRIMVTMPTEAAEDYELIRSLLLAGMDIARINTSHDNALSWFRMIANIKKGEQETGKSCLIYMDLSGPKFRTETVYPVVPEKNYVRLFESDLIYLVREIPPFPETNRIYVSVQLPEIFHDTKPGERIFFDDGKISGLITEVNPDLIKVKITEAAVKGSKLRADKGINLPDSDLSLPSLTEADLVNLPFIAAHADIIGYSFARNPKDVEYLQAELKKLNRADIGITLKIETEEAFESLPMMLLTAMQSSKVGVMIARGDLAVEIGFERSAEVQEEILWICEAAHVPGIWATQVLEKLVRKGNPTRAEVTDAAMAARAECVMLNKGPFIVEGVKTLDDIIRRMEKHQFKRKGNLRPLSVAKRFLQPQIDNAFHLPLKSED